MAITEVQGKEFDEVHNNKLQIIGKLTASLLHEIRNPLSAIKLSLNYMEMFEEELSQEIFESVKACSEGVNRIQFLIDQLLGFSRKSQKDIRMLSLNEVTDNVLNLLDSLIKKNNIQVEKRFYHNIANIGFCENNLLQIFINFITNAIEASEPKSRIIITTGQDFTNGNSHLFWEIEDNGVGIEEEHMPKIFDDFYTSKENGTGLGLGVCKMLLEENGAQLSCSSKAGEGTKFRIVFNNSEMVENGKQNTNC